MAGPGSRLQKAGTIFSRVRGLIQSGALKDSEKPIWYDVYAAFPPRYDPTFQRMVPTTQLTNILYKEDLVRAKFYKTYGNPDVIDMRDHSSQTVCQRFIDTYFEIQKKGAPENLTIFEAAAELLKSKGVRLRTMEENTEEKRATVARRLAEAQPLPVQAPNIQGVETSAGVHSADAEDILDEDIEHPNYDSVLKDAEPN